MNIAIGNDHAAVDPKNNITKYLESLNHSVINVGIDAELSTNYANYGYQVARLVADGDADLGIVLCSTGVGISIAANRVIGARCVVCRTPLEAELARKHFNINILALGGQIQGIKAMQAIIDKFLATKYESSVINNRNQVLINSL